MSTNNECEFIEVQPGVWYYILEDYGAPKNAWDWRDDAEAYGPFDTFEAAYEHLGNNHANPGGFSRIHYTEGRKSDETEQKLIDSAVSPGRW